MTQKTFAQAMFDALSISMQGDPTISVIGASSFVMGRGLPPDEEQAFMKKYADRLIDPPVSESVVAAVGVGAATAGLRPVINFGTSSFAFEAHNQIVNEAGNAHYMSGGQLNVPVVYHMFAGIRGLGGAQHSQSPQAMYANCPGLEVVLAATPADAKGLLRTAIKSNNPTLFITHTKLLPTKGEVPDGDYEIPFGKGEVKRAGRDVTIAATSFMVLKALDAAEQLAKEGIDAEVVDPRTIVPFDAKIICDSVRKTGRLVVAEEASLTCSVGSEIAATVAEQAFEALKAPILRVGRPAVPMPYSPSLEEYATPSAAHIVAAVKRTLKR
ncbi:MAG TPA: transketolase C-terminal domain-containing protein [Alphaproteobacteria bacterium]|jgi:pyruvate dehydrogenase E1 component beta subunit